MRMVKAMPPRAEVGSGSQPDAESSVWEPERAARGILWP